MTCSVRNRFIVGLLSAASLLPASAGAQTAAPASGSAFESETIVVTARRREENIQSVPLAVSALGGERLARENITSVAALNGAVPNLQIVPSSTTTKIAPLFAIRGLSQEELTGLADPSVSLYINDVVTPRA